MAFKVFALLLCCFALTVVSVTAYRRNDRGNSRDPHDQYHFAYGVRHTKTGDIKEHSEKRDGHKVSGHYELLDADGHKRIVDYKVDKQSGFHATMKREKLHPHRVDHRRTSNRAEPVKVLQHDEGHKQGFGGHDDDKGHKQGQAGYEKHHRRHDGGHEEQHDKGHKGHDESGDKKEHKEDHGGDDGGHEAGDNNHGYKYSISWSIKPEDVDHHHGGEDGGHKDGDDGADGGNNDVGDDGDHKGGDDGIHEGHHDDKHKEHDGGESKDNGKKHGYTHTSKWSIKQEHGIPHHHHHGGDDEGHKDGGDGGDGKQKEHHGGDDGGHKDGGDGGDDKHKEQDDGGNKDHDKKHGHTHTSKWSIKQEHGVPHHHHAGHHHSHDWAE